ncbi:30S ribosomal protein S8 [Candidatus Peregrinibacteria bacterium]|nr:30S ribosomal protein S8 [Candidatus Peregrinibacteria bacterium]
MMITDPIADYLTRIRNASLAKKTKTRIPYSKLKEGISKVLQQRKFIEGYEVKKDGTFKELEITLKEWTREPLAIKRVSTPGQRIYLKNTDIKAVKNGLGVLVISTSKGVMAGEQARKEKVGGEAICEVY